MERKYIRLILSVLTLISVYGILVRMGLFQSLFRYSSKCDQISETLTSLALSFVAALLFYAVTVVLPEFVNKRKAYNGLMPQFDLIYSDMSYLIGALLMMANIKKAEEETSADDWKKFSFSSFIQQHQWYVHRYLFQNKDSVKNNIRGWVDTERDLVMKINSIKKNIERINMSPLVRGLSLDTVELLRRIHQSGAINMLESILKSRNVWASLISSGRFADGSYQGFAKDMNDLVHQHLELRTLCDNPVDFRFDLMTEDEITSYTQERSAILATIPDSTKMQHIEQIDEAVMNGMRIL